MGAQMMKNSFLVLILLLGVSLAACTPDQPATKEDEQVLQNVWSYVQTTEMEQDAEWEKAWLNGTIEEMVVTENLMLSADLSEEMVGERVYLVSPSHSQELVAEPTIVVNPSTKEVIGEIPGE